MIAILDYGVGNIQSVAAALRKMTVEVVITADPKVLENAERIVFPGVGSLDSAMRTIEETGLRPLLDRKVLVEKTPVLGICLGMQLFSQRSDEGGMKGLGWIDAETVALSSGKVKVPHLGWNDVSFTRTHPWIQGLEEGDCFYFAHSYHVACRRSADVLATTHYGEAFASMIQVDNLFGIQFHPEKSHGAGMKLLRNFLDIPTHAQN